MIEVRLTMCHRSQMWHGEVSDFGCQRQQRVMETTGSCWNSTGLGSTGVPGFKYFRKVERPSQNLHFYDLRKQTKTKTPNKKKQQPWIIKLKSWKRNVSCWILPSLEQEVTSTPRTDTFWSLHFKGDRTPPTNPGENSANNARLQDAARRSELGHAQLTNNVLHNSRGLVGTLRIHQPCPVRGSSSAGCCSPECGWVERWVKILRHLQYLKCDKCNI